MVAGPVFNLAVGSNTLIDAAKMRVARLATITADPVMGAAEGSADKANAALALLQEADTQIAELAEMNGFSLA